MKIVMTLSRLERYFLHTLQGISMRELARQQNVEASTIKRSLERTTDLYELLPEWQQIIDQVETYLRSNATAHEPLSGQMLADAFEADLTQVMQRFDEALPLLRQHNASLQMATTGPGGIMKESTVLMIVDREIALVWIGLGLFYATCRPRALHENPAQRKPRTYFPLMSKTHDTEHLIQKPGEKKKSRANFQSREARAYHALRRSLGAEGVEIALRLISLWRMRETFGTSLFDRAEEELHPILFDGLREVVLNHTGLERFEQSYDLPARSAKIVLRIALETVNTYPEMRNLPNARVALDQIEGF